MKKKILTFLLLSLSLFISACECDDGDDCGNKATFTYSGRIIDYSNGYNFAGHTITFRHEEYSRYPLVQIKEILGHTVIDSQGYFSFQCTIRDRYTTHPVLYLDLDTPVNDFVYMMPVPLYKNWYREFNVSTMSGLVLHFSKPLAANEKLIWRYGYLYEIIGPRPAGFQPLIKIPNRTYSPTLFYGVDSIRSVNPQSVPYYPTGDPNVDTVFLSF